MSLPAARTALVATPVAGPTLLFWTRFIHIQPPPTVITAIESLNRPIALAVVRHFDKRETPRTARLSIGDNAHPFYRAKRFEQPANRVFGRAERQVSNENVLQNRHSFVLKTGLVRSSSLGESPTAGLNYLA